MADRNGTLHDKGYRTYNNNNNYNRGGMVNRGGYRQNGNR